MQHNYFDVHKSPLPEWCCIIIRGFDQLEYYVEKYSIMIYLSYEVNFRVNLKIMHIRPISSINMTADKFDM